MPVDTPLEVHVAAALDPLGALLGTERFETKGAGRQARTRLARVNFRIQNADADADDAIRRRTANAPPKPARANTGKATT